MNKLTIAFVCTHNSCRSIMAEGFMKFLAGNDYDIYSAGTEENSKPKKLALEVMTDLDIPMEFAASKLISTLPDNLDILITMGCGVQCPTVKSKHREDWGLTDPSGGPKSDFVTTRNLVEKKVKELINRIKNGEFNTI